MDGATTNWDRISGAKRCSDGGGSMVIDSPDVLDTEWGKAQVSHDFVEPMVWEAVKG